MLGANATTDQYASAVAALMADLSTAGVLHESMGQTVIADAFKLSLRETAVDYSARAPAGVDLQ